MCFDLYFILLHYELDNWWILFTFWILLDYE